MMNNRCSPPNDESESSSDDDSAEIVSAKKKAKLSRRPWGNEEKAATEYQFRVHIVLKKLQLQ